MQLSLQSFSAWVEQQAAAVQAAAVSLLDLTVGSTLRVILEANASVALWMQWLILQVLQMTRAATSNGADLDSWMADYALVRQPAVAATGSVTFASLSGNPVVTIAAGTLVKTGDGSQSFTVTINTANAAWNVASGAYIGTLPLTLPVLAQNAGIQGNVLAGTISLISAALPGVDTVINNTDFSNGIDAESDAALRARFVNYINTRSRATVQAVAYAVQSVQQGLTYTIAENQNVNGSTNMGHFIVTVDDGSGAPSSGLLAMVSTAVDAMRPVCSTFMVQGPSVVSAAISFTITAAAGYSHNSLVGPATLAVTAYVNGLPLGAPLAYSRLAQVIYDSAPGISNVTGLLVNGSISDVGGGSAQVVRASSVVVS